jgi:hypothetical protein
MEEKERQLRELADDCIFDVFIGCSLVGSQSSIVLPAQIVRKLALLPIDLIFDVYSSPDTVSDTGKPGKE